MEENIQLNENTIFETEEEFNKIIRSKNIYLPSGTVYSEFIKKVLFEQKYYDYVKKYFLGETLKLQIVVLKENNIVGNLSYEKSEILRAMEIYIKEHHLEESIIQKFHFLRDLISYDKLENKYNNQDLEIDIDNIHYVIKIKNILNFLNQTNYFFRSLCDDEFCETINDIPKEHFIYATKYFIEKENISGNYSLPNQINANIKDILNNYVDIEAINQYLTTEDGLYKEIEISEDIEKEVLKDMPKNLTELEKTIYIYIMLCKILTYDEEFQAMNQEGDVVLKHRDFHHVKQINLVNNRVTCYEFNLLYTKFLSKLANINFKSNYYINNNESGYGMGHVDLNFRSGKFLVLADSTEHIIHGDMPKAKRNEMISGIKCLNKNRNTQEEFLDALNKVYRIIAQNENKELYSEESFYDIIVAYQHKTNNYKDVDLEKKIDILIDKINTSNFVGVDAVSYILKLRDIIFNHEERIYQVKMNVVANTNTINSDDLAMLSIVIQINNNKIVGEEGTKYYLFTPHQIPLEYTFEELKGLFDEDILRYLERDKNEIQGIPKRGKSK